MKTLTFKKSSLLLLSIASLLFACSKEFTNERQTTVQFNMGQLKSASASPKAPKFLCIYYGWPSLVNGANGNVATASNHFAKFDLVVFGDGIWRTSHGDNAKTKTIIANLRNSGKQVYGYVDLGVATQNLSVANMKAAVNGWASMGVTGVFWDDAGYDYKVTRGRQNTMVDFCHNKGLKVCMNAWEPNDVLAGGDSHLNSGDVYLAESYLISNNNYQSLNEWKTKADKCYNFMKQKGIEIACLSTGAATIPANYNTTDQFNMAWFGTAMYNFDYFQMTNINYSANNNIVYFFPNISTTYGNSWKQADKIVKESATHYYRSTNSWTLHIYGNGSSYGYGTFTQP